MPYVGAVREEKSGRFAKPPYTRNPGGHNSETVPDAGPTCNLFRVRNCFPRFSTGSQSHDASGAHRNQKGDSPAAPTRCAATPPHRFGAIVNLAVRSGILPVFHRGRSRTPLLTGWKAVPLMARNF